MITEPHIVRKFYEMLKEYESINSKYEIDKKQLKEKIARSFRLTNDDVQKQLEELESKRRINQTQRRVRFLK